MNDRRKRCDFCVVRDAVEVVDATWVRTGLRLLIHRCRDGHCTRGNLRGFDVHEIKEVIA